MPPRFPQNEGLRCVLLRCTNEKCGVYIVSLMSGDEVVLTWPQHVQDKAFPDVPPHIADAANEAYRCFSISAYRASTLLARSVIEATAKSLNHTTGTLVAKIDAMYAANQIREFVKEGAHEVRYLGNDMAHGDFVDPVEAEEAELALSLMDEVLEEIFQAPARVANARALRLLKKNASAPTP